MTDQRVIRSFPSADTEFAAAVRDAVRIVMACPPDEVEPRLSAALRDRYPAIAVRRITALASAEDDRLTWYVFRDGRAAEARPVR